ncbi:MAG: glycosyltransferase family 4 protein [Acidimicrobiales bacterium]
MRILLLSGEHPSIPERTGGIGTFVAGAAAALAEAGHDVHLLVCAPGLATHDSLDGGVHLHTRGLVRGASLLRGAGPRLLAVAASCRWHARAFGAFDVVEAPEWQALGAGFALFRRSPLVVSLQTPSAVICDHDPRADRSRAADLLERAVASRADALLSISQLLIDELRARRWLTPGKEVELAPPILPPTTTTTGPSAATTGPVVLGIGRLEPRKGFDRLIDAVAELRDVAGVRVELVGGDTDLSGSGSYAADLSARAQRSGVDLRLHGRVSRDEIARQLAQARVVALPSTFDSFNLAGLEALAAGRPVVVTDRVGMGELADDTEALTVVPEGATTALAEAIGAHLRDPERAGRAGDAARRLVANLGTGSFVAHRERCYAALRDQPAD